MGCRDGLAYEINYLFITLDDSSMRRISDLRPDVYTIDLRISLLRFAHPGFFFEPGLS